MTKATARQHAASRASLAAVLVGATAWHALAQTPITKATIDRTLPSEIADGAGAVLPVVGLQGHPLDFFDDFSWRSPFVALNWPARANRRGEADAAKSIGDAGARVWETWKASWEIVPPTGQPPSPWASLDAATPCPDVPPKGSAATRVFGSFSRFGDLNEAGFGDQGGPLVAQDRTYTRYETRANQAEFDFIASHRLFLRSAHEALQKPGVAPLRFPDGSVEVKAAWRELRAGDPAERYYTVVAKVLDPKTGVCTDKKMGLVGLHIVHKTPLRPQWIWSSFEHVDNVPEPGAPAKPLSFNDPAKDQVTDPEPPTVTAATFQDDPDPTQVVRELPLHPPAEGAIGTVATNQRYQQALAGTVWANYALVLTQWPTATVPEDSTGAPFPDASFSDTSVGNTTMETYHQQATSCMDCHDIARNKKLDFVFFLDLHAFDDTFLAPAPASLEGLNQKLATLRAVAPLLRAKALKERK